MGKLTATQVKNAKPQDKQYKLYDGDGLYLLITGTGRYWRYDYRFLGKRKTLALGVFPDVSLKEARDRLFEARKQVANEIDPNRHRKLTKERRLTAAENSFEKLAWEWLLKQIEWTEGHQRTVQQRLENDVLPFIGNRPVTELGPQDILFICRRVESRGAIESAHRIKTICSQVFRYCVALGLVQSDPCRDLSDALTPSKSEHMATITDPKKITGLLKAIHDYEGNEITRAALQFLPLVFVRPGELRHAEWSEINLLQAVWKIPAEKMKMRQDHIVPLSRQAVQILERLQLITGKGKYVFPSLRGTSRPMSENTINAALRRLGYSKKEMTGHGFRSMASTRLHEMQCESRLIEIQLAHRDSNRIRGIYNYAEHLDERRKMMQDWADYLDGLQKSNNNVAEIGMEAR